MKSHRLAIGALVSLLFGSVSLCKTLGLALQEWTMSITRFARLRLLQLSKATNGYLTEVRHLVCVVMSSGLTGGVRLGFHPHVDNSSPQK